MFLSDKRRTSKAFDVASMLPVMMKWLILDVSI